MASTTTNKLFHTYENVGYDDQINSHYSAPTIVNANAVSTAIATNNGNPSGNKSAAELPFPDPLHGKFFWKSRIAIAKTKHDLIGTV